MLVLPALCELPRPTSVDDLRWLPHAEALATGCLRPLPSGTPEVATGAAELLQAPVAELTYTAVSLRVAVLAALEGRAFVHHELRRPIACAPELRPEVDVWDEPNLDGTWHDGLLVVPKYFSALLEAPLPTYDPNHRIKWRPHELLHRLARFFWRPDMSRFEAYLGARLSELLPVVHWHGFDEIGRPACEAHRGRPMLRQYCPRCEALLTPVWMQRSDEALHVEARMWSERTLEHLRSELQACIEELRTGSIRQTPRPGLDASSDAVGYLRGHWNRLTGWSFGAWVDHFLRPDIDYFESIEALLGHVQGLAFRLLGQPIEVDLETTALARWRATLCDVGYRTLLALEFEDDEELERRVMPGIELVADVSRCLLVGRAGPGEAEDALGELLDRLGPPSPANVTAEDHELRRRVEAGGWTWLEPCPPDSVESMVDGLRSALPRSTDILDEPALFALAAGFVADASFNGSGWIGTRFLSFLQQRSDAPASFAEAAALEAWLRASPTVDEESERFGVLPDGDPPRAGLLRPNSTLRIGRFTAAAIEYVLDEGPESFEDAEIELVAVHFGGQPRTVELTSDVREVLDGASKSRFTGDPVVRSTLLERGFLVWLPKPR